MCNIQLAYRMVNFSDKLDGWKSETYTCQTFRKIIISMIISNFYRFSKKIKQTVDYMNYILNYLSYILFNKKDIKIEIIDVSALKW